MPNSRPGCSGLSLAVQRPIEPRGSPMSFAHHTPCSTVLRPLLSVVRSCRSDDSLQRVAEVMWKHNCDYLLIVDTDGHPIGIITAQQLFLAAREQDRPLAHIKVSSAVSRNGVPGRSTQSLMSLEPYPTRRYQGQVAVFDIEDSLVNIVRADWLARYLSTMRSSGSPAGVELPLPRE